MTRFFSFITKANQLLFFFGLLAGIAAIGSFFVSELMHTDRNSVKVVPSDAPAVVETVSDARLLAKCDETYVIGLCRREVTRTHGQSEMLVRKSRSSFSSGDYSDDQIVNIRFVTPGKPNANLLKSDGLVLSHDLTPSIYNHPNLNILIFRCVTEDTDNNKVLDGNDRVDLYITSRDGLSGLLVIKGVSDYTITSDRELVVSKRDGTGIHLLSIDTATLAAKEIAWKD